MDKLYYNGQIITMTEAVSVKRTEPEAVLVSGKYIKKAGSLDLLSRNLDRETEWVDLQGKCLMPSFIDAHSHIVMNGKISLMADLTECDSFDDIIHTLRNYIVEHDISDDKVVMGYGYDHNFLKEGCHPDKRVLDKVSTKTPVIILHISGHLLCANSMAISLVGANAYTENPFGGYIGRIDATNEPNGYFEEAGMALLQPVIQGRLHIDVNSMMENMQDAYIRNGITTIQDGASTDEDFLFLKRMAELGKLKVDVVSCPLINSSSQNIFQNNKDYDNKYKNHLKLGAYKIILDGSPQGKSAWLSEPYESGNEQYCGYAAYSDSTVKKYILRAVNEKRQIMAHCNGDAASEQFISMYEACMENCNSIPDLRPVMIHCQTVRNDQLDRMAQIPMIASFFIGHVWYWGDVHIKNLGKKRGNYISPVKDAIDRNLVVSFHQDTPVTKPNMLHSIWCAVNRISRSGQIIGDNQKIGVYEALKAVTINAAYGYFEEKEKGSIEEGKLADMVILSDSPLSVDINKIKDIQVIETIKNGCTVFRAN